MLRNNQELNTTLERIARFEQQIVHLKPIETNSATDKVPLAWLLAEIDQMRREVREYLRMPPVQSEHWVCFACRKQFRKQCAYRKPPVASLSGPAVPEYPCPECKTPMVNMGKYFRPPQKSDRRGWENMRRLGEQGYRFHSEGSVAFLHRMSGSRPVKRDIETVIALDADLNRGQQPLRPQKKNTKAGKVRSGAMTIPIAALKALRAGRDVAAEIPTELPGMKAYIHVLPQVPDPTKYPDVWKREGMGPPILKKRKNLRGYEVRYLLHHEKYTETHWGWDYDQVLCDNTTRIKRIFLTFEDELENAIRSFGADPGKLQCGYDFDSSLLQDPGLLEYYLEPRRAPAHLWR